MTNPDEVIEEVHEEAPLDQSNGPTDHQMRVFCLNTAVGLSIQCDTAWGPDTTKLAREFYLFVSGQDPVIDVEIDPDAPSNVVSLAEFKESKGH